MRPRGNTTDGSVPNPRESTVDTERPPKGGAYNADTVVRSVPRELLMELNYALKPPKMPIIEAHSAAPPKRASDLHAKETEQLEGADPGAEVTRVAPRPDLELPEVKDEIDLGIDIVFSPPRPAIASGSSIPSPAPPLRAQRPAFPVPPRSLLSGWRSVCLIFVVAIAVIGLWFSR